MAISANVVWEIRTTGHNNHGGGFVTGASGTDYSQQDEQQYALTGVTTAAANAICLHASSAADMVGNICYNVSGINFIVGWFEIISVVVGVSFTLDRNCTTAAGSSGVINIGGAFLLGGVLDDEFTEARVPGDTAHVKTGTYTAVENIAQAVDGTSLLPMTWIGYTTTRNDVCVGTNRPFFDFTGYNLTLGDYTYCKNLRILVTGANGVVGGFYSTFYNCKFTNTSATAGRNAFYSTLSKLISCEFASTNGTAIYAEGTDTIMSCYVHDSVTGIQSASSNTKIVGNVIDTCGTGISYTAATPINHLFAQNVIYNCTTGVSGGACTTSTFINNIITACGTGASWTDNQKINFWDHNCWNNTVDVSNVTKGPHDITADPLLNAPATGDFTLAAGSPCFDAGLQISSDVGVV